MEQNYSDLMRLVYKREGVLNKVVKVVSVRKEGVVGKGDNFSSDIFRLVEEVLLVSGRTTRRSVVVKMMPESPEKSLWLRETHFFTNEIKIYRDVLPAMADLLQEVGDGSEPLWCRALDFYRYDRIVLEDLKASGYRMLDKTEGLDLVTAKIAIRGIGRLHGLSAVALKKGLLDEQSLQSSMYTERPDKLEFYIGHSIDILAGVIEKTWQAPCKAFANRIRSLKGSMVSTINKYIIKSQAQDIRVLCHGDCWINNILFKYNEFSDQPCNVKFVDFQMAFLGGYVHDLHYFLSTSVKVKVLKENREDLLRSYHEAFRKTLELFGMEDPENLPSIEGLTREVDESTVDSLAIALLGMPFMLSEKEDVVEVHEISTKNHDVLANERIYTGRLYTERVMYILEECQKHEVFGPLID